MAILIAEQYHGCKVQVEKRMCNKPALERNLFYLGLFSDTNPSIQDNRVKSFGDECIGWKFGVIPARSQWFPWNLFRGISHWCLKFTVSKHHFCFSTCLELVVPILSSTLSNPTKTLWFRYTHFETSHPQNFSCFEKRNWEKTAWPWRLAKKEKDRADFRWTAEEEPHMHRLTTEWQVSWQQNNHTDSWFAVPYGAILGIGHARLSPKATQRSREKGKPAAFAKRKGNWNEVIQLWSGEETKIPTTK